MYWGLRLTPIRSFGMHLAQRCYLPIHHLKAAAAQIFVSKVSQYSWTSTDAEVIFTQIARNTREVLEIHVSRSARLSEKASVPRKRSWVLPWRKNAARSCRSERYASSGGVVVICRLSEAGGFSVCGALVERADQSNTSIRPPFPGVKLHTRFRDADWSIFVGKSSPLFIAFDKPLVFFTYGASTRMRMFRQPHPLI